MLMRRSVVQLSSFAVGDVVTTKVKDTGPSARTNGIAYRTGYMVVIRMAINKDGYAFVGVAGGSCNKYVGSDSSGPWIPIVSWHGMARKQ